jgi:hypothetical protein
VCYRHRDSSLGDSVAWCLPEDLYALGKSQKFNSRVDSKQHVLNVQNRLRGIHARRGDGTLGEIVPNVLVEDVDGFVVARGPTATVEIGTEVKILAKAMINQIDRVMNDLQNQRREFSRAGGSPISLGVIGINQADNYVSYEGNVEWRTDGRGKKHPCQEAAEAERRLRSNVLPAFDEFLILRFRAWNEPPYRFQWVNENETTMDYGAVLTRILRKYDVRF